MMKSHSNYMRRHCEGGPSCRIAVKLFVTRGGSRGGRRAVWMLGKGGKLWVKLAGGDAAKTGLRYNGSLGCAPRLPDVGSYLLPKVDGTKKARDLF